MRHCTTIVCVVPTVGLDGGLSAHRFAGSCGERTFLDLTIAGFLS